jgi:hypothetical protein
MKAGEFVQTGSAFGQEDADALSVREITWQGKSRHSLLRRPENHFPRPETRTSNRTFHAMRRQFGIATETFNEE